MSVIELISFCARVSSLMKNWNESPKTLFDSLMAVLILFTVILKILSYITARKRNNVASQVFLREEKPDSIKSLERIYLPVFWLLRLAFWMSGPFLYAVYASKSLDGGEVVASGDIIRKIFLVGFLSAAIFLPIVGRSIDRFGRMKGTLLAALTYGLGAISTQSSSLVMLMAGRGLGALGTGLMTNIPEAWLASATKETKADPHGRWLGKIFATAYSFDYIVAICAGQLASRVSESRGPTGPFEISPIFLVMTVLIVLCFWKENSESQKEDVDQQVVVAKPSWQDGINMIMSDSKILLVGCTQSLFDAAMYIFVMQWAPAISTAASTFFGEAATATTTPFPYGTVFSCFMVCCLIGSTLHVELMGWAIPIERTATVMLAVAALSLASVAYLLSSGTDSCPAGLYELVIAFFVFETCVGMYFPCMSWLRSKYIPATKRSTITTLFSTVFIVINVSINLFITKVGVVGAWAMAASAIGLACLCLVKLQIITRREATEKRTPILWKRTVAKMEALNRVLQINSIIQCRAPEPR